MRNDAHAAITVGGKRKARLNIIGRQIWKIVQNLRNSHPAAEVVKHVSHGDTRATNARLATSDERVNGDAFPIVHSGTVEFPWQPVNGLKTLERMNSDD